MPTYIYTAPSGRKVHVTSDKPPTDEQLLVIFRQSGVLEEEPPSRVRRLLDQGVEALPMIGGAIGGIATGLAGGLPTLGMGAVPGAIAGATVGGGAGEALRQTIHRVTGQPAPATSGEAARKIAIQAGLQGAIESGGQAIPAVLAPAGRAIYRGYLKPSLSARLLPRADEIVETAIQEALPVSKLGAARAARIVGELRTEVDDLLSVTRGTVDLGTIAKKVRAFAKRTYYRPGADLSDYKAALAVADRLDKHPSFGKQILTGASKNRPVSLAQANRTKRALDASIGETAFGVKSAATTTTEKVARRAIRQDIETVSSAGGAVTPAGGSLVGALNARERRLIDVAKSLNRAVGREANRNALFGVPTLVSGLVGAGEYGRTGDAFAAATRALALRAALDPALATRAALVATRLGRVSGAVPATAARVAIQAVLESQQEPDDSLEGSQ